MELVLLGWFRFFLVRLIEQKDMVGATEIGVPFFVSCREPRKRGHNLGLSDEYDNGSFRKQIA